MCAFWRQMVVFFAVEKKWNSLATCPDALPPSRGITALEFWAQQKFSQIKMGAADRIILAPLYYYPGT